MDEVCHDLVKGPCDMQRKATVARSVCSAQVCKRLPCRGGRGDVLHEQRLIDGCLYGLRECLGMHANIVFFDEVKTPLDASGLDPSLLVDVAVVLSSSFSVES